MKELNLNPCLQNQIWKNSLGEIFHEDWKEISLRLEEAFLRQENIFPEKHNIFRIFNMLSPMKVKVVILGQDPYHQHGQADGLAFSCPKEKKPPSLRNIIQEITQDIHPSLSGLDFHGDLGFLAQQGVFLLNTFLTVKESQPLSHRLLGWEKITDQALKILSEEKQPKSFLLWGKEAARKATLIDQNRHLILTAPHPSPLSAYRGFFGCRHFSKSNQFLRSKGRSEINWIPSLIPEINDKNEPT